MNLSGTTFNEEVCTGERGIEPIQIRETMQNLANESWLILRQTKHEAFDILSGRRRNTLKKKKNNKRRVRARNWSTCLFHKRVWRWGKPGTDYHRLQARDLKFQVRDQPAKNRATPQSLERESDLYCCIR